MLTLTNIIKAYARWSRERFKNRWDSDFAVFRKQLGYGEFYSPEAIELALLHIEKATIREPTAEIRRLIRVETSTDSIEQLLGLVTLASRLVEARDSMSSNFLREKDRRQRLFDDYFLSEQGHVVSIEKIITSINGRANYLLEKLQECEVHDEHLHQHYLRKLLPLLTDTFNVLQAIHSLSYR